MKTNTSKLDKTNDKEEMSSRKGIRIREISEI